MESSDLLHLDSVLEHTFSVLRSQQTGLGTGRDKSLSYSVNPQVQILSEFDRNAIFRTSGIAKKLITLYPMSAARGWCKHVCSNTDFESDDLEKYFDNLQRGSLREIFLEASIEARLHGDSYILLGVEDGKEWDEPIDENNIKSFRWAEPIFFNECEPYSFNNIRNPEKYLLAIKSRDLEQNYLTVHKSRLIRLTGNRLYGSALYYNRGKNDSVLESFYQSFQAYLQGTMTSSAMLADYSLFKYKLKNLARLVKDGKTDDILQRFLTIQMGMSVVKGLAVDADNEDAEFISRSYGGVKDIVENLLDQMIANCDTPRYKLIGESDSSNGKGSGKAEQERFEWAGLVAEWQDANWRNPIKYCQRLAFLAKDGITSGKLPESFDVEFSNTIQLSPVEEGEVRLNKAKENEINIRSGIYSALEVRESQYGQNTYSSEINLDEEITEKIREKTLRELEEPDQNPDISEGSQDLKNSKTRQSDPNLAKESKKPQENLDNSHIIGGIMKKDSGVKKILNWNEFSIGLEFLPGDMRFNKPLKGCAYGHIRNHIGEDGESLDVYVAENLLKESPKRVSISRISQLQSDGSGDFDEYKIFLGYSPEQAKKLYLSLFPENMFGGVEAISVKKLKTFKRDGYREILDDESFDSLSNISEIDILKTLESIN